MTSAFKINKKEMENLLNWAEEDLKSAKDDLKNGYYRSAVSRSYYAAFDSVRALLLTNKIITKTHSGIASKFNQTIKEQKIVPIIWGRWFGKIFKQRQSADYDVLEEFNKAEISKLVSETEEFITIVKKYLDENTK